MKLSTKIRTELADIFALLERANALQAEMQKHYDKASGKWQESLAGAEFWSKIDNVAAAYAEEVISTIEEVME